MDEMKGGGKPPTSIPKRKETYLRYFKNRASLRATASSDSQITSTTISATLVLPGVGGSIIPRRYSLHLMKHAKHLIPNADSTFPATRTTSPNLEE